MPTHAQHNCLTGFEYTRQLPVEMQCSKRRRIRLCSSSKAKGAFCSCVAWGWRIYNIVESESDPLTRRPVDLFKKEPLKGNSEVHLHTPTKFGEDPSKDLGGDREQTNACSNYSMILCYIGLVRNEQINVSNSPKRALTKGNILNLLQNHRVMSLRKF